LQLVALNFGKIIPNKTKIFFLLIDQGLSSDNLRNTYCIYPKLYSFF